MTRQITVKLNEKKFAPILKDLKLLGGGIEITNSEAAGKAIFFTHRYLTKKETKLGNKTRLDSYLEASGYSRDECTIQFLKEYAEFISKKS